jgi:hypothetical protein
LSRNARELSPGFHQQHAGKERLAGKMSPQKGFSAADGIFSDGAASRIQIEEPINEPEFRTVR